MVEFHCGFETAWERERGNYELIMNYEMSRPEGRGPTRLAVAICCNVVACLAGIMGDFAWRPLVKQV